MVHTVDKARLIGDGVVVLPAKMHELYGGVHLYGHACGVRRFGKDRSGELRMHDYRLRLRHGFVRWRLIGFPGVVRRRDDRYAYYDRDEQGARDEVHDRLGRRSVEFAYPFRCCIVRSRVVWRVIRTRLDIFERVSQIYITDV